MQTEVSKTTSMRDSLRDRTENALRVFHEEYAAQHKTRLNRRLHLYGRTARIVALPLAFYDWRIAIGLFVLGYLVQFLGHAIEGTSPSFFRNPKHLLLGSLNHVIRAMDKLQGVKVNERK